MEESRHSVIILGSGCAGLTAAIYLARAGLDPLVIEGSQPGGQLTTTTVVENFPGFPEGVNGADLMASMRRQAERFGTKFAYDEIQRLSLEDGEKILHGDGATYRCDALLIASGSRYKLLDVPGEREYFGRGVSVCATCDGAFFKKQPVVVVGGGDSAAEEALFLSRICSTVYLVHRRDALRASKIMGERLLATENIVPVWDSAVEKIVGSGETIQGIDVRNLKTEKTSHLVCSGVFIAIGSEPNSQFAAGVLERDKDGYIVAKAPDFVVTSVGGIFVAGDCQDRIYRQAIVAAGNGCKAALALEKYLAALPRLDG